jgi:tRNA(His) 5'-end guanylyltransferase
MTLAPPGGRPRISHIIMAFTHNKKITFLFKMTEKNFLFYTSRLDKLRSDILNLRQTAYVVELVRLHD